MTVTLAAALLIQAVAVAVLRIRLGGHWLRHPVTLLVLTSVVYQGLSPLVLADSSIGAQDYFRLGIAPGFTDNAALLLAASTFALTVTYLLTRPERVDLDASANDIAVTARVLDWRLLLAACVPLAVLTYQGRGFNNVVGGVTDNTPGTASLPVSVNLASTFFTGLVALTAFAFLLRHGKKWFLPVVTIQAAIVAAAGERSPILIDTVALVMLLTRAGMRPPQRGLRMALSIALLGGLAITGARAEQGRAVYNSNHSLGSRVRALGDGLAAGIPVAALGAQLATRTDGTSFTAAVLQDERFGQHALSAAYVPESLLVLVPSALWPSKIAHGLGVTSPYQMEIDDFSIQNVNPLPGLGGLESGFLSPAWLIAFMAMLGLLAGWGERWLLRECTPARLMLLAGAVIMALSFEEGLPGILLALRAALVLAVVVKVLQAAPRLRHHDRRLVLSAPHLPRPRAQEILLARRRPFSNGQRRAESDKDTQN